METSKKNSLRLLLRYIIRKRYKLISMIGVSYIFAYMFMVGIISYYPSFDLSTILPTIPYIRFTSAGIIAALSTHVYMFVFYHTIAFMSITAFLVGLNVALLIENKRHCNIITCNRTLLSFIPPLFTTFACCSGGVLAFAIGPVVFSYLAIYSIYFALISIMLLLISNYLTIRMLVVNGVKI